MKIYFGVGILLLACSSLLAQSGQSSQPGQTSSASGMNMGSNQDSQSMSNMHQQMQTDMQQMKAQIDKMRADAEKVQDPNAKTALLDNAKMWEQFMTRMQSHMQMMQGMHQGGMAGMHHHKSQSSTGASSTSNPK